MDIGSIVIGIIFLLICIIIFVILSRSNRKKEKELLQSLIKLAEDNRSTIDQYNIWHNAGIGIDKTANIIFSVRNINDESISRQVILSEMKKCKVITANRSAGGGDGSFREIEKVELVFTNRDSSKPDTSIVFYSADDHSHSLNGEFQLTEKWYKMANDTLTALPLKK